MTFEGALVREQGTTFGIVVVKPHVVQSPMEATEAINAFSPAFGGAPTVLVAQDGRGRATFYGRRDIVNFLSGVALSRIPWKRYTLR